MGKDKPQVRMAGMVPGNRCIRNRYILFRYNRMGTELCGILLHAGMGIRSFIVLCGISRTYRQCSELRWTKDEPDHTVHNNMGSRCVRNVQGCKQRYRNYMQDMSSCTYGSDTDTCYKRCNSSGSC